MALRETLNKHQWIAFVAVGIAVVIAIWVVIGQFNNGGQIPTQSYFTTDDGATYFADNATKLAPFDVGGKPAYRVIVFRCKDGKNFVGYMERYTDKAKQLIKQANATPKGKAPENINEMMAISVTGREYKRPGDKEWGCLPWAAKLLQVKCSDGSEIEIVQP